MQSVCNSRGRGRGSTRGGRGPLVRTLAHFEPRRFSARGGRFISRGQIGGRGVKRPLVSVVAPNIPALYEMCFAVLMAGAVLNTVNICLDSRAMALQFRHCEPKFVFVDYQYMPVVVEAN
jgi:acyl-CoA synthetase (AMP-forming)/AMP-acid ligase II